MGVVLSTVRNRILPLKKGGQAGDQIPNARCGFHSDPHPKISVKFSTSPFQGEVKGAHYV